MPGRQLTGSENYRYAYQGREKDPETGKEAFQLRLWDGRIGRWLTTDPYGQFFSPYLGMGNNPVSIVDPDGGFSGGPGDPDDEPIDGGTLNEVVITCSLSNPLLNKIRQTDWNGPPIQHVGGYNGNNAYQYNYLDKVAAMEMAKNFSFSEPIGRALYLHLKNNGAPYPIHKDNFDRYYGEYANFVAWGMMADSAPGLAAGAFGGGRQITNKVYSPKIVPSRPIPNQPIAVNTTARPGNAIQLTMRSDVKSSTFYSYMNPEFSGQYVRPMGFASQNGIKWSYYKGGGTNPHGFTIKGQTPQQQIIIIRFSQ